jgi:hypothetical protein
MIEDRDEPKVGFLSIVLLVFVVILLGMHFWNSDTSIEHSSSSGFISLLSGKE